MVQGFEKALAEYESKMMAPYDKGGALYNGEDDEDYEEDDEEAEEYGEPDFAKQEIEDRMTEWE